jgi:hypothetical protein
MDSNGEARFGRWVVTGKAGRHLLLRCGCGAVGRALPFDLRSGKTTMCRACKYELRRGSKRPEITKHGLADSPTMTVWTDMKRRCLQAHRKDFARYGGRGIRVCDRWVHGDGERSGFECFLADMGVRPSTAHQIDRIDNDGNYEPRNCRWVLRSQQTYNRADTFRFEAFGRSFNLQEAAEFSGLSPDLIWRRIKTGGFTPERAITEPRHAARL